MPDRSPTELIDATDALLADRQAWEPLWDAVQDYLLPDATAFNQQDVAGATRRDLIVSNFGENALEEAADGLVSLACNPAQRWKGNAIPGLPPEAYAEQVWLEDANSRELAVYANPRSRFVPAIKAFALEWLALGAASLFCATRHGDIPLFEHRPLAEMAWTEGDSGFVEENCWFFEWPAFRALARWGDACPETIKKAAADPKRRLERFKFRHYVYPRENWDPAKRDAGSRRFRECWLAVDAKTIVAEGGFFTNPYVSARLNKRGSWAYGRGRGVKALADVKMLQRVRRATVQGAEKVVNPPLQAPDDGVMGDPDLRPGMTNFVRPEYLMRNAGIQPITTGARPDIGMDFEESVKADVRAPLLNKALNVPAEPRMLVDQVMELKAQAMAAAGPIVGEFQTEALGPIALRTFDVMARTGMFAPPPPGIVAAGNAGLIKPEFESPAARAQNLGIVSAIAQRNQVMLPVWQARPELMDVVDWEATSREVDRILGIPAHLATDPAKYRQMVEARNQVAQNREDLNSVKDATTALKNAAPALALAANDQGQQGAAA